MELVLRTDDLRDLATVANVASTDSARPLITAVCVTIDGVEAVFTATDSYGLVIMHRTADQVTNWTDGGTWLVPAKGLLAYAKSLPKKGVSFVTMADATTYDGRAGVSFTSSDGVTVLELIDGNYPDVSGVIPAPSFYDGATVSTFALSPVILAKFAKVAPWTDKTAAFRFRAFDAARPVKIEAGESARVEAYIMPVRFN